MNKSGRNKIKQRSAVSRKLLMQYVISIIGYVVGVMLFVFVAWRFCMMFIWQPDDPLYILLQTVKEYIILFLGIIIRKKEKMVNSLMQWLCRQDWTRRTQGSQT